MNRSAGGLASRVAGGIFALLLALVTGCFQPAIYEKAVVENPFRSAPASPPIVRGRDNAVLDGLGHYVFSFPAKLVLWNWSVDNHRISEDNEAVLRRYLELNGLTTTQVRLNSYAPQKEFARLHANKDVGAGYKYTLGSLTLLFYTLLPDRLFAGLLGGDSYNPFTNTIHIYSDHPAILVHEGGHAKDFAQRRYRGGYAALRLLPFTDLFQEQWASEDAVSYFACRRDDERELNAYPILYPAYATYVGGYTVAGPILIVGAHIAGRVQRSDRREELATERRDLFHGTCWVSDAERRDALGLEPPKAPLDPGAPSGP